MWPFQGYRDFPQNAQRKDTGSFRSQSPTSPWQAARPSVSLRSAIVAHPVTPARPGRVAGLFSTLDFARPERAPTERRS